MSKRKRDKQQAGISLSRMFAAKFLSILSLSLDMETHFNNLAT